MVFNRDGGAPDAQSSSLKPSAAFASELSEKLEHRRRALESREFAKDINLTGESANARTHARNDQLTEDGAAKSSNYMLLR